MPALGKKGLGPTAPLLVGLVALDACVATRTVGRNEEPYDVGPVPLYAVDVEVHAIRGEPDGRLGDDTAIVGDLDGDGIDDFVLADSGIDGFGRTYIFYGRASFDSELLATDADATIEGSGGRIERVGDLDGDGLADFAYVGATGGGGHVVYGRRERLEGAFLAPEVAHTVVLEQGAKMFGIKGAGDVNGDGYADLVVEVRNTNAENPEDMVSTYLVYGGAQRISEEFSLRDADVSFVKGGGQHYGLGAASAGDTNGDGYSDLLLRSINADGVGWVGLYYGGSATFSDLVKPDDADARFALPSLWFTMAPVGDLDGDGLDDIVVPSELQMFALYGKRQRLSGDYGMADVSFVVTPESAEGPFHFAGLASGDLDGDGDLDLLIGDPHEDRNGPQTGGLYLALGASHRFETEIALGEANALLYGRNLQDTSAGIGDYLGVGVASGGDVNGDGFDDALVGAPSDASNFAEGGTVHLVLGGPRAADCCELD